MDSEERAMFGVYLVAGSLRTRVSFNVQWWYHCGLTNVEFRLLLFWGTIGGQCMGEDGQNDAYWL